MATYTYTLANVRSRAEFKLRDDRSSTQVDNWINDTIQNMTAEIFFDEMYVEDSASVLVTGDGSAHIFDLPEDFQDFVWMYSDLQKITMKEASPRQMIEDRRSPFDLMTATPEMYTRIGRTGAAGVNGVPLWQVKFDTIIPNGEKVYYGYYAMHQILTADSDYILLPQNLLSTIVDGVLMESDSWNDSDQFAMHRDRFMDKMNQLKRNQNRRPNRRRTMGLSNGQPPVAFPPEIPNNPSSRFA